MAEALYLSVGAFTPDERADCPELVPVQFSEDQLDAIGQEIAAGRPHHFDEQKLNSLLTQHAAVSQVTKGALVLALWRIFAPAVALIVVLLAVASLIRYVK